MRVGLWKDVGNYEKMRFSSGRARYQEVGIANMASDYQELGKTN